VTYECEIVIVRDSAQVLAEDFKAVSSFLEQRQAERGQSKPRSGSSKSTKSGGVAA
jgi:hypothetical protein